MRSRLGEEISSIGSCVSGDDRHRSYPFPDRFYGVSPPGIRTRAVSNQLRQRHFHVPLPERVLSWRFKPYPFGARVLRPEAYVGQEEELSGMEKRSDIRKCAVLAVCLLLVETAQSLRCYQCVSTNSTHPFQCNEVLSDDIDMIPESCDGVFGAQYCVKHTGRFEDGIGTKRFCSSVDRGNYCDYVNHKGDKLTYRTCIFTCTGDGCNPATTSTPNPMSWITPFIVLAACRLLLQR